MVLFGIGGGMSIHQGFRHLQNPGALTDPTWSYVVLAIAFVVEGIALAVAVRELRKQGLAGG